MGNPVHYPKRMVLLCGCGGVGKTSLTAALGYLAARNGDTSMIFTIDPARRLADTLGIRLDTDDPVPIPLPVHPSSTSGGTLQAAMFTIDRAAESLVHRYADSDTHARTIIDNRVFRLAVGHLSGTEEFLALGKLYQLMTDHPVDTLIVDTAPSRHALDFLSGPDRLLKLIDPAVMNRIKPSIHRFVRTGTTGGSGAGSILGRIVSRIAGDTIIDATIDLIAQIATMYDAFTHRVHNLHSILRDRSRTRIILVASPMPSALDDARTIYTELSHAGFPPDTIVFNRVTPPLIRHATLPFSARSRQISVSEPLFSELPLFLCRHQKQVERETLRMTSFLKTIPHPSPCPRIPLLPGDIRSLDDLEKLHPYLADCV
ncbi:ArsA family ATPase [bacterium]|nr:ArsA family ATPase [candidate division CSSED10-310 bacterium]